MKKSTWFKNIANTETKLSALKEIIRIVDANTINSIDKNGRSALMLAIIANHNDEIILSLLDKHADPNLVDSDGMTALHLAVGFYTKPVIDRLIESGAYINAKNNKGETPLLLAAATTSKANVIDSLIAAGANIHEKNNLNAGIAMYSATNKHPEIMAYLNRIGVDRSVADSNGLNSLHMAIKSNSSAEVISTFLDLPLANTIKPRKKLLKKNIDYKEYKAIIPSAIILASIFSSDSKAFDVLLKAGADIEERDLVFGWTPLMHAVVSKRGPEIVRYLLSLGAQINACDDDGMTPLMLAAKYNDDIDLYLLLREMNADITPINISGESAEQIALSNDCSEFEEYFRNREFEKEKKILFDLYEDKETKSIVSSLFTKWEQFSNSNDCFFFTPLMLAAEEESEEVISLLLQKGSNINFTTNDHEDLTALFFSISNKDSKCFSLLLDNGASLSIQGDKGNTILEAAIINERADIVELLIKEGIAIVDDKVRSKSYLLEHFFGPSEVAWNSNYDYMDVVDILKGSHPIIVAAYYNSEPDIIKLLIQAGADINERDHSYGKTVLMWAIESCHMHEKSNTKMIESLIDLGSNLFLCDHEGKCGWHYLCKHSKYFDLKRILEKVPNINIKDKEGSTPLMKSLIFSVNEVELFLQAGSDVNAKNKRKLTVLMQAIQVSPDNSEIIKLLLAYGANIEAVFHEGFSVLMVAIIWKSPIENIKPLIHAGAKINARNKYKTTALMLAVVGMNFDLINLLIQSGADVTVKDYTGDTALMRFIDEFEFIVEEVENSSDFEEKLIRLEKILLEHDKPKNIQEYLMNLNLWNIGSVYDQLDPIKLIKPFIEAGGDINFSNKTDGITPFMIACKFCKNTKVIRWLIKEGANIHIKDKKGNGALFYAIAENTKRISIAKILIQAGADVNAKNDEEMSLLDLADVLNKQNITKLLVEAGAHA